MIGYSPVTDLDEVITQLRYRYDRSVDMESKAISEGNESCQIESRVKAITIHNVLQMLKRVQESQCEIFHVVKRGALIKQFKTKVGAENYVSDKSSDYIIERVVISK